MGKGFGYNKSRIKAYANKIVNPNEPSEGEEWYVPNAAAAALFALQVSEQCRMARAETEKMLRGAERSLILPETIIAATRAYYDPDQKKMALVGRVMCGEH